MMKTAVFGAAAFVAIVACGAVPVSVTNGKSCPVPSFEGMPYVQEGEVAAIRVPNAGWKIDWQRSY